MIGAFRGARPTVVTTPAPVLALAWRAEADGVFVSLLDGTVERVGLDGAMTEVDRLPAPVGALAVSEDGKLLAMGGDDGLVRVLDLATGTRRDLGRHANRVRALTFARGSALLASGSRDDTARLWRLSDGSYRVLVAPSAIVQLAFSDDGKVIVSTSRVGLFVQRWSTESGEELPPFAGHRGPMTTLSLSSDGRHLLTGSQDRSARLFDAVTGKSRALQGHRGPVVATAFAAGGKLLVTLGEEGVVRAWPDDLPLDMAGLRDALEAATPDRIEGH
jgi:WD40 repeat protein